MLFFFSSRRRHTRCALVTGVQTCALPISYRIHMRIVDRYRNGRIVLAGDAAHLNSPSGGMGMNGGIHDAHELVATLADIANGGSLDLLDRYVRRRRPIAEQEILVQADRNRARMQERDRQSTQLNSSH